MGMHMRNSYSLMCVCLVTRRDGADLVPGTLTAG